MMLACDVERLEIRSSWTGFADPPHIAAELVLLKDEAAFQRHWLPTNQVDLISSELVQQVLTALSQPPITELDLGLLESSAAIKEDYDYEWTDDYPAHRIHISFSGGRWISIETESQHVFMLPFSIRDWLKKSWETFDVRLSVAIAALMPDKYLEKERLAGARF
ncbi:MAG: hypothetical protein JWP89_6716 [Schlesneria sp.]|nr:hypothetical protein [Schlesneria sp.]